MRTYTVNVTALACVWRQVEVEAATPAEAERKALAEAADDEAYFESDTAWQVNGLFDPEGAHPEVQRVCALEVTEIVDEDGNVVEEGE